MIMTNWERSSRSENCKHNFYQLYLVYKVLGQFYRVEVVTNVIYRRSLNNENSCGNKDLYICAEKEKNGSYKNKNWVLVCRENSAHSRVGQNQHAYDLPHINVENSNL
jgi:hypothetical protein